MMKLLVLDGGIGGKDFIKKIQKIFKYKIYSNTKKCIFSKK